MCQVEAVRNLAEITVIQGNVILVIISPTYSKNLPFTINNENELLTPKRLEVKAASRKGIMSPNHALEFRAENV